jgi:nucleotide-binding universal stress UspA family protein
MKSIVIAPTDFSDVSINAVNYAADMAVSIDAMLMLMHVNEYIYAYSEAGVVDGLIDENNDSKLEDIAQQLSERTGNALQVKNIPCLQAILMMS